MGSGVPGQSGDVDSGSDLAGGTATVLLAGSDGGADFAGGGGGVAVMNTPPAVFADGVTVAVTSLAIAGVVAVLADADMVAVGVADLADAGMAFPADLVGVVAADVATLADAGLVTVGVADLAVAGMAFPADLARVVATNVTTLTDAELVTVGVADLAHPCLVGGGQGVFLRTGWRCLLCWVWRIHMDDLEPLFLPPAAPKARDGRYCNAPVCLSVRPSVRPSVMFSFRTVTQKRID